MGDITVITNHQERLLLSWWDLTDAERAEFDYYPAGADADVEADFVRYKGVTYDLSEFMVAHGPELKGWDGISNDTFFSGVLVKFTDQDHVVMGRYFS